MGGTPDFIDIRFTTYKFTFLPDSFSTKRIFCRVSNCICIARAEVM